MPTNISAADMPTPGPSLSQAVVQDSSWRSANSIVSRSQALYVVLVLVSVSIYHISDIFMLQVEILRQHVLGADVSFVAVDKRAAE